MVSLRAICKYRCAFPDDICTIGEPGERVLICSDGKTYPERK